MNVKTVVDRVAAEGRKNATVHVLTGNREDAEAIAKQAELQFGPNRVQLMGTNTHATTIPESPVVIGNWTNFCFAYARLGEFFLGPDAELRFARQDQLLSGVVALIVDVPEEDRKVPCVISGKGGILASVKFSDFTSKYKQVVEMTA
jgi:hypothetical protein